MPKILLIEDDPEAANIVSLIFNEPEYDVVHSVRGDEGLTLLRSDHFDLILLDITLPDANGFQICKKIREEGSATPLMMVTSQVRESDKVLAFELGADDYITKPLPTMELKARVKALLRRAALPLAEFSQKLIRGRLEIDPEKRIAMINKQRIELTVKEFELLILLAASPGKTFSRAALLREIWGHSFKGYERTVTSHINRLRIKIETDPAHPHYILTSWGVGYRFSDSHSNPQEIPLKV